MSALHHRIAIFAPPAGTFAIVALLGATFLASPVTVARAADTPAQTAQATPHPGAADAAANEVETVEQRITNLHTELKVTPEEEAKWNNVAQAMRENAAAMEKLAAARTVEPPQSMTAIDDLKSYEKFAQGHVDGLKNLISSFEVLYRAFPDAQKKNADIVFQTFGQKAHEGHS
jgi:glutamine synthetase adenylyltransferase